MRKLMIDATTTPDPRQRGACHRAGRGSRTGAEKDPYLLILTPAREMNFLKPKGALDRLQGLITELTAGHTRLGDDYWRVRDYYYAGLRPSQNFNVRKVMAYESFEQDLVTTLLKEALAAELDFADLGSEAVRSILEKCSRVGAILEEDAAPADQARRIAEVLDVENIEALAQDLERAPIRGEDDPNEEGSVLEQSDAMAAVELTTIVGAKGLSADHVIVLGCDEVNLSRISRSAFFVAITRARKSLTLMMCLGGGGAKHLHDFIQQLPAEHTQAVYVKSGEVAPFGSILELQSQFESIEYAKMMAAKKAKERGAGA